MATFQRAIDEIEGGLDDMRLGVVRNVDDDLDNALIKPNSQVKKQRKQNDVDIAYHLNDHDWNKEEIRRVLIKKNQRDSLFTYTDDTYFNNVLESAEYMEPSEKPTEIYDDYIERDDDDSDTKFDLTDHMTDSDNDIGGDIDSDVLERITFD